MYMSVQTVLFTCPFCFLEKYEFFYNTQTKQPNEKKQQQQQQQQNTFVAIP